MARHALSERQTMSIIPLVFVVAFVSSCGSLYCVPHRLSLGMSWMDWNIMTRHMYLWHSATLSPLSERCHSQVCTGNQSRLARARASARASTFTSVFNLDHPPPHHDSYRIHAPHESYRIHTLVHNRNLSILQLGDIRAPLPAPSLPRQDAFLAFAGIWTPPQHRRVETLGVLVRQAHGPRIRGNDVEAVPGGSQRRIRGSLARRAEHAAHAHLPRVPDAAPPAQPPPARHGRRGHIGLLRLRLARHRVVAGGESQAGPGPSASRRGAAGCSTGSEACVVQGRLAK
ncbi:hypothetical protein FKP32DRAFT_586163 [Trametes sanguinea]|nr:hypothetical protein FKP32DRAFT_586163 [Trametes sanguinea]